MPSAPRRRARSASPGGRSPSTLVCPAHALDGCRDASPGLGLRRIARLLESRRFLCGLRRGLGSARLEKLARVVLDLGLAGMHGVILVLADDKAVGRAPVPG